MWTVESSTFSKTSSLPGKMNYSAYGDSSHPASSSRRSSYGYLSSHSFSLNPVHFTDCFPSVLACSVVVRKYRLSSTALPYACTEIDGCESTLTVGTSKIFDNGCPGSQTFRKRHQYAKETADISSWPWGNTVV